MIIFITGVPGTGKTAAALALIQQLGKSPEGADRPVFVHGIPDLAVPHVPLADPTQWMTDVPDGAIVVVDEAQKHWPARGPGSKIPPSVEALQTHRHRGLTFIVITQMPKLVDPGVRELGQRHIYLRDLAVLGRWWYEWPAEIADNPRSSWRTAPIKRKYRLPKSVFQSYTSATEHVKVPARIPPQVWLLLILVPILGYMAWHITGRLRELGGLAPPAGAASAPGSAVAKAARPGASAPVAAAPPPRESGPYAAAGVHLVGAVIREGRPAELTFALSLGGRVVQYLRGAQLVAAGYSVSYVAPCVVMLGHGLERAQRTVLCDAPVAPAPAAPKPPAGARQEPLPGVPAPLGT